MLTIDPTGAVLADTMTIIGLSVSTPVSPSTERKRGVLPFSRVCVVWEAVPRCEKQSFSANTIGDWNRWLHHCAPPAVSNRFGSLVHIGTRPDQQPKRKQASDHSQAAG